MTVRTPPPAALLRRAATVLTDRGLSKGAVRNPSGGAVDVTGAMMLACGTKFADLTDDLAQAVAVIPQAHLPAFLEAWEAVDATVDGLEEWQDAPGSSAADVIGVLLAVAERLERRAVP